MSTAKPLTPTPTLLALEAARNALHSTGYSLAVPAEDLYWHLPDAERHVRNHCQPVLLDSDDTPLTDISWSLIEALYGTPEYLSQRVLLELCTRVGNAYDDGRLEGIQHQHAQSARIIDELREAIGELRAGR